MGTGDAWVRDAPRLFANRFDIERRAGAGGMGTVYRARDRHTGDWVALKLVHAEGGHRSLSERFAREARLLSELLHPGIVAYVAHGQAPDGQLFLAMEWLDGEDLGARLARGPLSIGDGVALLRRVAEALAVAHRRGVVHRDLKPGNLFLVGGEVGRVKVLDFGIARRLEASRAMTGAGVLLGTPSYMAPEQAGGSDLAPAADVFSLGCVLYECLAGDPPFVAEHVAAVLARILFEDPAPVESRRPDVPAPLAALVRRMLEKQPTRRIPDAAAILAALDALGEPAVPTATTVVAPARPSSFAEHEQGLFSLVVGSPPLAVGDDATVAEAELTDGERRDDVRSALVAMGLSAGFMADGSLVVKVTGTGSAMDQVAYAARAALAVAERWPEADVALATGRGAVDGPFTVGEVADRAFQLLRARDPSAPGARRGVRVDALSAQLLGSRFALMSSPEGTVLTGETKEADVSRPLLGKPTPCVGRDAELGSLEALFAGCIEESEARAVLVTAPPGAGKSRLRHELLRRIARKGEPVTLLLEGRGDAMSAGAAHGILAAAIRGLAAVGSGQPHEERRRLLRDRVGRHVNETERERVVRFVGELCDVPFPDEDLPMLRAARHEPKIMGDCIRRAALDFLAAECSVGPVLVVLDDLQWGDALTVSTLNDALREQAGAPLFVLAFARPEIHEAFPMLWHGRKTQRIALHGLGRKACERLIREVLGKDVPAALVERAVEQSAGNALFLEEMIRAVAAGKGEEQPETVVAMLQARMGRLPPGPRRALQAASVFGNAFWGGGVARVLAEATADVTDWLSTLIDAELIQPSPQSRLPGEKELVFWHASVRDAAYGLLTAGDVATGHRLAAAFLEAAGDRNAAVVAEHAERGGDREKAATLYLRAAEDSLQRGDYTGARRVCEKGFVCAPEGEVLGELKSIQCYASLLLDTDEGTSDAASTAMALLRRGTRGWYRAIIAAGNADPARMPECVAMLAGAEPHPDPDSRIAHVEAQATCTTPMLVFAAPEPLLGAHLDRLALSVDGVSDAVPAVQRYSLFARGLATVWRYPRPWSAMMDYGQCLRLAQQVADRKVELGARVWGAEMGWLEMGDVDGAHRRMLALEEALSNSEDVFISRLWAVFLARILCELPEEPAWGKAEALMQQVLANRSSLSSRVVTGSNDLMASDVAGVLARVALARGQLAEAAALFQEAMTLLSIFPVVWMMHAPAHVRALVRLGRAAEGGVIAEHILGVLTRFGGAGCFEVEARLAVTEAFGANDDHARARAELAETLRQIQLRADDITDPFWKNSYLTRNPHVANALALAQQWRVADRGSRGARDDAR